MKYKGKVITGSSLLTILGVMCFATILVAAAVLSNAIATPSKTVTANEITLSLTGAGTGVGSNWATAPAYGGDPYYQNVLATLNSYAGTYYIYIQVKEDTTVINSAAWNFAQVIDSGGAVAMTYHTSTNTWYSASAITASGPSDALLFNFVCGIDGYSATLVTLNFQANSGIPT